MYLENISSKRVYMDITYQEWDHANNCAIEKQICRVIDREPGKVEFAEMPLD